MMSSLDKNTGIHYPDSIKSSRAIIKRRIAKTANVSGQMCGLDPVGEWCQTNPINELAFAWSGTSFSEV